MFSVGGLVRSAQGLDNELDCLRGVSHNELSLDPEDAIAEASKPAIAPLTSGSIRIST